MTELKSNANTSFKQNIEHGTLQSSNQTNRQEEIAIEEIDFHVRKIVADQIKQDVNTITNETALINIGLDSLDHVELMMAVEEKFKCDVPDEDASKMKTIQCVVDFIKKTKAKTS